MTLKLTKTEIDTLWDQGYRPFEIYTKNPNAVEYYGEIVAAGTIDGWDIQFVFAKRDTLATFPFFDCVIGQDCVASCTKVHHG